MERFNVYGVIIEVEAAAEHAFVEQLDVEYGFFRDAAGQGKPDYSFQVCDTYDNQGQELRTVCGNQLCLGDDRAVFYGEMIDHDHFYLDDFRPYFTTIIYMILYKRKNFIMFHAACFAYREKSYLIMGESGAGKSSISLLNLLNGAEYLSNDITYLAKNDQTVLAYGLPQIMNLGEGALQWFQKHMLEEFSSVCELVQNHVFSNKSKACFQINRDKVRQLHAPLNGVVFVERDFNSEIPWFEEIDASCATRKMFEGIRPMDKVGLHPTFPLEMIFRNLYDLFAAMKTNVKFYNFYWTKDHLANFEGFQDMLNITRED